MKMNVVGVVKGCHIGDVAEDVVQLESVFATFLDVFFLVMFAPAVFLIFFLTVEFAIARGIMRPCQ